MKIMSAKPVLAADLSVSTRAFDGEYPEPMIAFTGHPSEGAIQDPQA